MSDSDVKSPASRRRVALLMLGILPVIAWFGLLDDTSSDYVNASLAGAGVIYGTARGINALVSVLQGTELDIVFITAAIGEVLDPVNDLIERFSGVVLIAIGALALQKLLLGLVSHSLFNALLTLLAIGTAYSLLRGDNRQIATWSRCFLVAIFLRFSLGVVVLANNWVDAVFLRDDDLARHAAMESFRGDLREASALAGTYGPTSTQLDEAEAELKRLADIRTQHQQNRTRIGLQLAEAKATLSKLIEADRVTCTALTVSRHTCSKEVMRATDEADRRQELYDRQDLEIKSIEKEIKQAQSSLDCMRKRFRGQSCGFTDRLSSAISPTQFREKMARVEQEMGEFVETAIDLLMSLLLKSIVIPLAFFYLIIKLTRFGLQTLN